MTNFDTLDAKSHSHHPQQNKLRKIALALLSLFVLLAAQQPTFAQQGDKMIYTSVHSTLLQEERKAFIHLPKNYFKDINQRYAVMYVLDASSQHQHLIDKSTVLSDAGLIPEIIIVGIPNYKGNRNRDQTPPFMRTEVEDNNSAYGAADKFLSFIETELIPFIDGNYRTSSYRILNGNSRSGLFVLYSLMEKPDLFKARFCHSTPVWRFDSLMVTKADEFLQATADLDNFLFISVGEKETDRMIAGFNKMVSVLGKNTKKSFKWAKHTTPDADHQSNELIATSKGLEEWGKYLKDGKDDRSR